MNTGLVFWFSWMQFLLLWIVIYWVASTFLSFWLFLLFGRRSSDTRDSFAQWALMAAALIGWVLLPGCILHYCLITPVRWAGSYASKKADELQK
ncbi:MAG: hypothetical protein JWM56_1110 [Candidatus Peribacteria bacterium]|nr:hypothetical protein [Candidatus Peribacteria bacterium]